MRTKVLNGHRKTIDVPDFFFRGGGQTDPLEFRIFFSGGGLGDPGGKQGVNRIEGVP